MHQVLRTDNQIPKGKNFQDSKSLPHNIELFLKYVFQSFPSYFRYRGVTRDPSVHFRFFFSNDLLTEYEDNYHSSVIEASVGLARERERELVEASRLFKE